MNRINFLAVFSLVLMLLLPTLHVLQVAASTGIFNDGFESGTLLATDTPAGKWDTIVTSGASIDVTSGSAHHGTYKAEITGIDNSYDYAIVIKNLGTTYRDIYARVYVQIDSKPTTADWYDMGLDIEGSGGGGLYGLVAKAIFNPNTDKWGLRVYTGGNYVSYYEDGTSTVSSGQYYCVEQRAYIDGTNGILTLWVDDVQKLNLTGMSTNEHGDVQYIVAGWRWVESALGATLTEYVDCVVADTNYIGEEAPPDSSPPTFGSVSSNTSLAGQPCSFNCLVNDNVNVSTYVFSINNTGTWTNDTAIAFSSFFNTTAAWANVTKTLNGTVGNVVSYLWYANDTSNNWSNSDQYNLTTSALQRYLTVISPYGTPGGQSWYDNGSTAYATLDTGIVDQGNGTRRLFTNWSGDATGTDFAQSDPITMDENKTAIAVWKTQYNVTFTHSGLDSSASGKVVTVNGDSVTYDQLPYSFWADSDSTFTYSYDNVSSIASGKRFILTGISGPSPPITLTAPAIVTGDYGTQYEVTFDETGVETDFTGTVVTIDTADYSCTNLPVSFWWDKDSTHNFSFGSPLVVNTNKQYNWNTTSGLTTLKSATLTITTFGNIVGNYLVANRITFDLVGVSSDFTSTVLEVDGIPCTVSMLPVSFVWEAGSVHSFTFFSPLVVTANAKQYLWISTIGLSNLQSDTITVMTYGSITGNYNTQYYLTVASPYGTPNGGGWYDSGTTANTGLDTGTVDYGNGTRKAFTGWTGDASGTDYLQSKPILMDGPKNAVANWKTQDLLGVLTDPAELTPQPTRNPVGEDGPTGWWYDASTNVTLTAQSITGYNFTNWDVDGVPQGDGVNPITLTMNGSYTAKAHYTLLPPLIHDIAVTKITPTKTVIGQSSSVSMNVTVENRGETPEDFNVTIYANSTQIGKQTVTTFGSNTTKMLTFTWNTTGFAYGNYTISAYAWPVPNETNTADNNLTGDTIYVGIPGDVNGDGAVDIYDAVKLAAAYGYNTGESLFNPNADINGDGTVDIYDAVLLAKHYGQHYP